MSDSLSTAAAGMVSIIVPTLNRHDALERFLCSVDAQRFDRYEVLVIDQSETSTESLVGRHRHARYFQASPPGLSRGRNVGLRHAAGDLLMFSDDDCVLAEDALTRLSEYAPRLSDPPVFGFGNALNLEDDGPVVPTFRPVDRVGSWRCDTLCSISLVFNRSTLDRVGGFDEAFGMGAPFPAGEETDLLLRIIAAGGRGVYLDRLTIRHPRRSRTPDLASRYESFGFAQGALARKHAGNRVFLVRFGYGILRSLGGLLLSVARGSALAPLYWGALRGKARGFLAFRSPRPKGRQRKWP